MVRRINPGALVQSTIAEIRKEKSDSQLWKDFMLAREDILNELYQDYLMNLAYERLYGSETILSLSVMELPIPSHAKNILKSNGMMTVRELIKHSFTDLSQLQGLGQTSLRIIIDYLSRVGFELSSVSYYAK